MSNFINIALPIYFSISITLSQILHTYYVKKDPKYNGRLGIGIPFFNKNTVDYKFGYISAIVVFFSSMLISLSIFNLLPALDNLSVKDLFFNYSIWIFLPLVGLNLFSWTFNPSATKILLDSTTLFMVAIILYSSAVNPNSNIVMSSIIFMASMTSGMGIVWVSQFQKHRLDYPQHVWFIPSLYYFASLIFNMFTGTILAIVSLLNN